MPVRNEYAFFNPNAIPSESKETPQLINAEASSLNLLSNAANFIGVNGKKSNLSNMQYQPIDVTSKNLI